MLYEDEIVHEVVEGAWLRCRVRRGGAEGSMEETHRQASVVNNILKGELLFDAVRSPRLFGWRDWVFGALGSHRL